MALGRDSTSTAYHPPAQPQGGQGGMPDWLAALLQWIEQNPDVKYFLTGQPQSDLGRNRGQGALNPDGSRASAKPLPQTWNGQDPIGDQNRKNWSPAPPWGGGEYEWPPSPYYGPGPVNPQATSSVNNQIPQGQPGSRQKSPYPDPRTYGTGLQTPGARMPSMSRSAKPPDPMTARDLSIAYLGEYNTTRARLAQLEAEGDTDSDEYLMLRDQLPQLSQQLFEVTKYLDGQGQRDFAVKQQQAAIDAAYFDMRMQARGAVIHDDEFRARLGMDRAQLDENARQFNDGHRNALQVLGVNHDFTRGENALDRKQQLDVLSRQQGFSQGEREATQRWNTGEREATQQWQAGETDEQRQWQSGEADRARRWESEQARIEREWQRDKDQILTAYQKGQLEDADADRALTELFNRKTMELNERRQNFDETESNRRFGLDKEKFSFDVQDKIGTQMGNRATFGENQRQFDAGRYDTQRKNAMDQINKYLEKGYAFPGQNEYQEGGRPGGSIAQIAESFGGPKSDPAGYLKPQMPLQNMQPAVDQYLGPNAPAAPATDNPALAAYDEWLKRQQSQYAGVR